MKWQQRHAETIDKAAAALALLILGACVMLAWLAA